MLNYTSVIDVLGTISFAVSGTSVAMQKKLDIFGIVIIAFITSIGGGTLRDLLLGDTPVAWLRDSTTINVILVSALATVWFGTYIRKMNITLFLFDAMGLGLFTFIGINKGLEHHLSAGISVALGTLTGCFGGVIRDVLLNEIPLVFRKEIYASTCIAGGLVYFYLTKGINVHNETAQVCGMLSIVLLRIIVVRYKLQLPSLYKNN
jgi:uncharacterized membrane protein YeiH